MRNKLLATHHCYFDIFNSRAFYFESAQVNLRLKRYDKVDGFGVKGHLYIRCRRISRRARVRVIYSQQRLIRFAYATHRREQIFRRCKVARLRPVSAVRQGVHIGNQTVFAAQQAAAFRRPRPDGVFFDCQSHLICYANKSAAHPIETPLL